MSSVSHIRRTGITVTSIVLAAATFSFIVFRTPNQTSGESLEKKEPPVPRLEAKPERYSDFNNSQPQKETDRLTQGGPESWDHRESPLKPPANAAPTALQRSAAEQDSEDSGLRLPAMNFPDVSDFEGLEKFRDTPKTEQKLEAVQLPGPKKGEKASARKKEIEAIKKELGLPKPKVRLKSELYDPWAAEYENVVAREHKAVEREATRALKAREEFEKQASQKK